MNRQLKQLRSVSDILKVPVVCAGDIFHKWDSPAELINFACWALPKMYAVPGQHDLPNHNYEDMKRSAYWTLAEAGVIHSLTPNKPYKVSEHLTLHGFPWGFDVKPTRRSGTALNLAVVHAYCFDEDHRHPEAEPTHHVCRWWEKLEGYDAAVFGDNHKAFSNMTPDGCSILNHGTFFRRNSDEYYAAPAVGILRRDGSITRHLYNVEEDKWSDLDVSKTTDMAIEDAGMSEFVASLDNLGEIFLDFEEAVVKWLRKHKVPNDVRDAVLRALRRKRK